MQVGIDNEEPGREAKNETTKKIIFIKIPNVQNDNEDNINMNSNVNSNVHMQSQSQRSINKPKKSIIPYEKPPAVFLPTEKPFITNDNSNSNYLSTPHNSVYKPQSPNNEDDIISSSIDNNKQQQHVLSLDENDINNKPQLNSTDDNILDNISCSLVWTSIPVLSYIFPFIGHVGITDSIGRIHDFGSSHYISIDQMTYGNPDKIIHFEITNDDAVSFVKNTTEKFDIIFLDPPYKSGLGEKCLPFIDKILSDNGIAILEDEIEWSGEISGLIPYDKRKYGRVHLTFFKKEI